MSNCIDFYFFKWGKDCHPPEPGEDNFIGPPTLEDYLNVKSVLNPFTSTKIDDWIILITLGYVVYRIAK